MTTPADIKALIESDIEDTALADRILETLRPFDGKPISKRIATAVGKALPDHTVYYDNSISMFHLNIWGAGIEYNNRKSFLLGYTSSSDYGPGGIFRFELYRDRFNACHYSAARERNEKRRALMGDRAWLTSVASTINALNTARARYESLVEWDNPVRYDLAKLIVGDK